MTTLGRLGRLGRRRAGDVDPGRVLRRRRSPLQLALVGILVALVVVVEVLILRAYGEVSRTTAIFGRATFLTGNLVNLQRELVLFNVEVERLPSHRNLDAVRVRRGLVGNQFNLFLIKGQGDSLVEAATGPVERELRTVDRALARAAARPTPARLRAEVAAMRPPLRRAEVHLKQLYDQEEQALFGAVGDALAARARSERLLVGLSALVLAVGSVLALSLRQRVR